MTRAQAVELDAILAPIKITPSHITPQTRGVIMRNKIALSSIVKSTHEQRDKIVEELKTEDKEQRNKLFVELFSPILSQTVEIDIEKLTTEQLDSVIVDSDLKVSELELLYIHLIEDLKDGDS